MADLTGDVTVGVSSPAVSGVASLADLAEEASLADLAGEVTVGVMSLADPVGDVTAGMTYQKRCDVLSGSVYDYDYCCDNEPGYFDYDGPHHYDDDPDYFVYDDPERGTLLEDYDVPGDVGHLRFSDFTVPNGCGPCRGLHGPSERGECCVSRGEAGMAPFWPDDEELDGYVGQDALLRTESDGPIDTIVCAFELVGPDGACDEARTGFNCMFDSVVCTSPPGPGGTDDEDSDIWEEAIFTNVVSTVGPSGPCDEDSLPRIGSDEPVPV